MQDDDHGDFSPPTPDPPPEPFNQPAFFLNITAALGMGLNSVNRHTLMPATTRVNWVRLAVRLTPPAGGRRGSNLPAGPALP